MDRSKKVCKSHNSFGYSRSTSRTHPFKLLLLYLNKYTSNSLKGRVLEIDFEYPKELWELHKYYPLVPDKIKIKIEMLSEYHLKIADLYNIPIGNVKRLVPNLFDKEKYVLHYENLKLCLRLGLKQKKYIVL